MKKIILICVFITGLLTLNGCALGAATAAYSLNARTAESLTASAEDRLVERVRDEVIYQINQRE